MLPLLMSSAHVGIIDDDCQFLEALGLTIPQAFDISLHSQAASFEKMLHRSAERAREEQRLFFRILQEQSEPGGRPITAALRYLASPTRFEVTGAAFVDYTMPRENGVSLVSRHNHLGLQRILLTGQADNEVAISAFNSGCIEMFIPKQSNNLHGLLPKALRRNLRLSSAARGRILSHGFSMHQLEMLNHLGTIKQICQYIEGLEVEEYVLLGKPFGMVALRANGQALWIQLEDAKSLPDLVELLGEDGNWKNSSAYGGVKAGKGLVCLELAAQVPDFSPTYEPLAVLSEAPFLGAAAFHIGELPVDLRPLTHGKWKAHSGQRQVQ